MEEQVGAVAPKGFGAHHGGGFLAEPRHVIVDEDVVVGPGEHRFYANLAWPKLNREIKQI